MDDLSICGWANINPSIMENAFVRDCIVNNCVHRVSVHTMYVRVRNNTNAIHSLLKRSISVVMVLILRV
jgi:hypothetical protein